MNCFAESTIKMWFQQILLQAQMAEHCEILSVKNWSKHKSKIGPSMYFAIFLKRCHFNKRTFCSQPPRNTSFRAFLNFPLPFFHFSLFSFSNRKQERRAATKKMKTKTKRRQQQPQQQQKQQTKQKKKKQNIIVIINIIIVIINIIIIIIIIITIPMFFFISFVFSSFTIILTPFCSFVMFIFFYDFFLLTLVGCNLGAPPTHKIGDGLKPR